MTHFTNPKVQASIAANTYVVSGPNQTKKLQDLLPGIINQLGPDNLEHLKKLAAQYGADGDDVPRRPRTSRLASEDENRAREL